MVNKKRLIKTIQKLISLDSQNPPGDERKIAEFVGKYLKDLGLKIKTYTFSYKRVNILATLPGKKRLKSLLLTPHLDTVPAGASWKTPALRAKIIGNRIYGLGATDCKGNLASALKQLMLLLKITLNWTMI